MIRKTDHFNAPGVYAAWKAGFVRPASSSWIDRHFTRDERPSDTEAQP